MNKDQVLRTSATIGGLIIFVFAINFLFKIDLLKNGWLSGSSGDYSSDYGSDHGDGAGGGGGNTDDETAYCYEDCEVYVIEEEITECSIDVEQESITSHFGLRRNFNDEKSKELAQKIKAEFDEMEQLAAAGGGEYMKLIFIDKQGNYTSRKNFLGIGGGEPDEETVSFILQKLEDENLLYAIKIHTHDKCSAVQGKFMCKDEKGNNVPNPDNPPSVGDFLADARLKISFSMSKAWYEKIKIYDFVVECDGDVYSFNTKKDSVLYKYAKYNFKVAEKGCAPDLENKLFSCFDTLVENISILEQKRQDATTIEEANKATDEYVEFLKKNGLIIEKINFTAE